MKFANAALPLVFLFAVANVDRVDAQSQDNPEIVAITIHADWCGTCRELNPKVENVKTDFEEEGVLFTRFDFTDDFTTRQSRLMANWTGIGDIFRMSQDRGATGYMILVDGESSEVVGTITNQMNEDEIREAIAEQL